MYEMRSCDFFERTRNRLSAQAAQDRLGRFFGVGSGVDGAANDQPVRACSEGFFGAERSFLVASVIGTGADAGSDQLNGWAQEFAERREFEWRTNKSA